MSPGCANEALAGRPYVVDDMLKAEGLGRFEREPRGRRIVFERGIPYDEAPEYWASMEALYHQISRRRLYTFELGSSRPPTLLLGKGSAAGYRLGSFSPDGRRVSFLRADDGHLSLGVYDLQTGQEIVFDVVPDAILVPKWISATQLLLVETPPERMARAFADRLTTAWRTMRSGQASTASVAGSGRYLPSGDDAVGLVLADVTTGKVRRLGHGLHIASALSADGRLLAAIRGKPRAIGHQPRVINGDGSLYDTSLVIYDLEDDGVERYPCAPCDVLQASALAWSISGGKLAFVARERGKDASSSRLWIYDSDVSAHASPAETPGLDLAVEGNAEVLWLSEAPIVRARGSGTSGGTPLVSWWLVRSGGPPVDVLSAFAGAAPSVVGVFEDRLIVEAGGDVWSVAVDGTRREMTAAAATPVRVVRGVATGSGTTRSALDSRLVVEASVPALVQGKEIFTLFVVDLRTGALRRLADRSQDDQLRIVAPEAGSIVATSETGAGIDIDVLSTATGRQRVLRMNGHVAGIERHAWQPIRHSGIDGESLVSWILLPTDSLVGTKLPLVVDIYPGSTYASERRAPSPTEVEHVNPHLLASNGYAVLYASVPMSREGDPGEPALRLADKVLAAVDAAVEAAYADPDRLALQGHSYGAYGTLIALSQTARFRAAVAIAGSYDLVSKYGNPRFMHRFNQEWQGFDLAQPIAWAESHQARMGGPPWRDPSRYLRNSPLLQVESITTPVMLVHGDMDNTVSFSQSEEMFTALYRLGRDAQFVRYWGEGHAISSPANLRDLARRVLAWYDTHLGKRP